MDLIVERVRRRVLDPTNARTTGTFGGFKLFPPVGMKLVEKAEKELGFPLPSLLKNLYLEVANGGFGPGYGFSDCQEVPLH